MSSAVPKDGEIASLNDLYNVLKGLGFDHAARSLDIQCPIALELQSDSERQKELLSKGAVGQRLLEELNEKGNAPTATTGGTPAQPIAMPLSPSTPQISGGSPLSWYFAYGSNMSKEQAFIRIGKTQGRKLLRLDGYRLVFNKTSTLAEGISYANVMVSSQSSSPTGSSCYEQVVYGVGYLCTVDQVLRMDHFEGVHNGQYERKKVSCTDLETGERISAHVYIALNPGDESKLNPSPEYLGRITEGEDLLPAEYVSWIRSHPTSRVRSPRQDQRERKEL